jgi:ankyrin repeat protein
MFQPEALKTDAPLLWSTGTGHDVWRMFRASMTGDLDVVQQMVVATPGLVRCQYAYRQPLYFAVRENRLDVARYLLDRGADPVNSGGSDTLVQMARDREYSEMVRLLESAVSGSDGAPDGDEIAAAIRTRDRATIVKLLDASPDVVHARDHRTNQPIHWAAMTRQLDIIDELLARGADVNARRCDGARPVHLFNGDYHYRGWRDVPADVTTTPAEVVTHLLARGADYDIWTASHRGDVDRVRTLLDQDPSLVNRVSDNVTYYLGSGTPLRNAAAKGHADVVLLLLDRGADPNTPEEGIAPHGHALYSAVYNGHHGIARQLLDRGAYPNPEVESSADALSIALSRSDRTMVELLCMFGAARSVELLAYAGDIQTAAAVFKANPELSDDPTALMNAALQGHEAFVRLMLRYQPDLPSRLVLDHVWAIGAKTRALTELLFEHGMKADQTDWLGVTALHHFARRGHEETAGIYLDRGADIDARDEDLSSTPLAWAAKHGQEGMVAFLLRRGARPRLPDDPPWATPMAWAGRRGHAGVMKLLEQFA